MERRSLLKGFAATVVLNYFNLECGQTPTETIHDTSEWFMWDTPPDDVPSGIRNIDSVQVPNIGIQDIFIVNLSKAPVIGIMVLWKDSAKQNRTPLAKGETRRFGLQAITDKFSPDIKNIESQSQPLIDQGWADVVAGVFQPIVKAKMRGDATHGFLPFPRPEGLTTIVFPENMVLLRGKDPSPRSFIKLRMRFPAPTGRT